MILISAALALAVAAPPVQAPQDLTGKWTGSFITTDAKGKAYNDTVVLTLKQDGKELSGTALTGEGGPKPFPISKGQVVGNRVSFVVVNGQMTTMFMLTLADNHLKGEATTDFQGQKLIAKVDVQRAK